ncbi:variable surface protein [Plasmodium gonderi]|uniref:Variable surface protein n=1 Tax=Plasmodium gonderi TaxID=77519 RepID=A0A1Y1JQ86_PLAGO|nr:variable surface protein [Plasmodium gonderi]GAW84651.1 variable surface protein [Plasmodium gonderi]
MLLTWIYLCFIRESRICKYLDMMCCSDNTLIMRYNRLLVEIKTETLFDNAGLKNNLSYNFHNRKLCNVENDVSTINNLKNISKYKSKRYKKSFILQYAINIDSEQICYIYKCLKSIDYSIKDVVRGHSEKSINHNLNEVITNKTIEKMLRKDYILINSAPLTAKLSTILFSIFEAINNDIAIKSIHFALVIIFAHKYSNSTYGMNKSLDSLLFLTLMITCLSQIFYAIGEYVIWNKYEDIILEEKRDIKEKYEKKALEKKEIKEKKKEEKIEKKKQKLANLKDLDTYMNEYNDRYDKRMGLGKLDCLCEKKIFNQIDNVYKLAHSPNKNNRLFKKALFKKYGMKIFLTNFFYLIAAVIGIIQILNRHEIILKKYEDTVYQELNKHLIPILGDIFVYVIPFILTLAIIYIFIKIEKYERLKARKGYMSAKEYYHFCKDIFK